MCFELDSLPPVPVIARRRRLARGPRARGGRRHSFAAFAATPDEPAATGIVVLPDVRGLYRFYEELALRFAERGLRGGRDRLLRPHGGRREARGRLPYRSTSTQTTPGGDPGRRPRRRRLTCASRAAARSSRSASASAAELLERRRRRATASPARSASTAGRRADGRPARARRATSPRRSSRCMGGADQAITAGGRRRRSTGALATPASSTRSRSTTARRTASSTAARGVHRGVDRRLARVLAFVERYSR